MFNSVTNCAVTNIYLHTFGMLHVKFTVKAFLQFQLKDDFTSNKWKWFKF